MKVLRAKKQVGHGKWLAWLKGNVRFSQFTASAYMRVAKNWEQMKDLSNLSLRDVLQMLTEDRSDEETDPKEDKPVEFCTVEQFNRMSPSGTPRG